MANNFKKTDLTTTGEIKMALLTRLTGKTFTTLKKESYNSHDFTTKLNKEVDELAQNATYGSPVMNLLISMMEEANSLLNHIDPEELKKAGIYDYLW